jgi:hypothetical protein
MMRLIPACPTLARTWTPPASLIASPTCREETRFATTTGCCSPCARARAISAVAINAVRAEGGTAVPVSSTTTQRSASPSKASPRSAPTAGTRSCSSCRFSGTIGLGGWCGKVPSRRMCIPTTCSEGTRAAKAGTVRPAIALPASTTTFSGRSGGGASASIVSTYSSRVSIGSLLPVVAGRSPARRCCSASSRTRSSPVAVSMGRAPGRQNLSPLSRAGLWEAVIMIPATPRCPLAQ